jgi:tetratricopeptide (TPR) repeat protein
MGDAMKCVAIAITFVVAVASAAGAQVAEELARRQAVERFRTGQDLMATERYEQAATEFTAAIGLDPLLTLAHYGLGQARMALKQYAAAVTAFRDCRTAYEQIAALQQRNAGESERRRQDEINELKDSINRIRTGQIKNASPGQAERMEARVNDLERTRRTSADRMQIPAELSLALGSAYFRNGQREDAEREWKAAVSVNDRLGEAHNNLAALYAMSGRKKEADAAVRAAERARFRVNPQLKADIDRMQ